MKSTIEKLFIDEFGFNIDDMAFNTPYNVEEANIGILSFDEENNSDAYAKVISAIKKPCKNSVVIKLENRNDWEEPVDAKHLYAIYKSNNKVDYCYAEDLVKGNRVLTSSGLTKIVDTKKDNSIDFTLDIQTSAGNYYTNDILSHNSAMAKLPNQCVVPSTIVDIVDENGTQEQKTMEQLFEKAGFSDYKKMKPFEFYDVSDKKIYIKSYNEKDKKVEYKIVESLVYKGEENIYDVVLKDGTVLLSGSAGHYIYDANKEDYVSLGDTKEVCVLNCVGDKIYCFVKDTAKKESVLDIQVRDNSNYFSNDILSHNTGGTAIKYFSSTRNRLSKLDTLKNGDDAIGIQIRVRNYKNKTGIPNRDAIMNLYFDGGFNSDDEYFDFLVMFGLIHKAGGWFDAADIGMPKLQGSAKVKDWLKQNPDVYDGLKKKVDNMLMSKTVLDENNIDYEKAEQNGVTIEETKTPAQLAMESLGLQDNPPDLGL